MLFAALLHALSKTHLLVVVSQGLRALEGDTPLDVESQCLLVAQGFDSRLVWHAFVRRQHAIMIRKHTIVHEKTIGNLSYRVRPGRTRGFVFLGGKFDVGVGRLDNLLALFRDPLVRNNAIFSGAIEGFHLWATKDDKLAAQVFFCDETILKEVLNKVLVGLETRVQSNIRGINLAHKQAARMRVLQLLSILPDGFLHLLRLFIGPNAVDVFPRFSWNEGEHPRAIARAIAVNRSFTICSAEGGSGGRNRAWMLGAFDDLAKASETRASDRIARRCHDTRRRRNGAGRRHGLGTMAVGMVGSKAKAFSLVNSKRFEGIFNVLHSGLVLLVLFRNGLSILNSLLAWHDTAASNKLQPANGGLAFEVLQLLRDTLTSRLALGVTSCSTEVRVHFGENFKINIIQLEAGTFNVLNDGLDFPLAVLVVGVGVAFLFFSHDENCARQCVLMRNVPVKTSRGTRKPQESCLRNSHQFQLPMPQVSEQRLQHCNRHTFLLERPALLTQQGQRNHCGVQRACASISNCSLTTRESLLCDTPAATFLTVPRAANPDWIDWRKSDAREVILDDLNDGRLPLDEDVVSAEEAWEEMCCVLPEFENVVFSQFKKRLKDHRKQVARKKNASSFFINAFRHDRRLRAQGFLPGDGQHDRHGNLIFERSAAKPLLREAVIDEKHKDMTTEELCDSQEEFRRWPLAVFRRKLRQEIATQKWLCCLEWKRAKKLLKRGKKKNMDPGEDSEEEEDEEEEDAAMEGSQIHGAIIAASDQHCHLSIDDCTEWLFVSRCFRHERV